jgi:XRE family aerobic/anaerobic benzoate catabolism transcriptional regulator
MVAETILAALAERVRRLRGERGWTRAQLARRSGLSVRFLARIEAGDGNVSLLRLAHLAEALDTPLDQLVRPARGRTRLVALVGLRGAGKSTVGPKLAALLDTPFLEMDGLIREASGLPLDQIFELHGERYYRRIEREALGRILHGARPVVLAAAGGVVNEPPTWDLLLSRATVVWLKARPEDHWNRVVAQCERRPMADNPGALAELRAMLAAREPLYAQSHHVVDTHGREPDAVAGVIAEALAASRA